MNCPHCPHCHHARHKVLRTQQTPDGVKRRHLCAGCGKKFTSYDGTSAVAKGVSGRPWHRAEGGPEA
ncbi:MAG: hypothetical protein RLZZ524_2345 [Pseudomonadota bacterium]